MKIITALFLTGSLFLIACGGGKEKEADAIPAFYEKLNVWLEEGTPESAQAACRLVAPREIKKSKEYAKVITNGNICQAALEENFSFLLGEDQYQLVSIDPAGSSSQEKKVDKVLQVQTVRVRIETPDGTQTVPSRSAALVQDGLIDNLAGMRLSTVAPKQFSQSLGTDRAIPIDPLSAAYYSSEDAGQ